MDSKLNSPNQDQQPYSNAIKVDQSVNSARNPVSIKNISIPTERTGHWTEKQNAKYYAFLKKFKHKFDEKESRRQWKVFKVLSQFVRTRNPNQCRSHHHKMQKNFRTVQQTLNFLIRKRPNLQKKYKKYSYQLQELQSLLFVDIKGFGEFQNYQYQLSEKEKKENQPEIVQENLNILPTQKKSHDITLVKTGLAYEDYEPVQNEDVTFKPVSIDSFPTTSFLFASMPSECQIYHQCQPSLPFNSFGANSFYGNSYLTLFQNRVLECHESFLKWYEKASSLMGDEKSNSLLLQKPFDYGGFNPYM